MRQDGARQNEKEKKKRWAKKDKKMTKEKIISLEIINCESVFKQAYNKNS